MVTLFILQSFFRLSPFEFGWEDWLSASTKPYCWKSQNLFLCAHARSEYEKYIAQSICLDQLHPRKSISAYRLGLTPASFTHSALEGQRQWTVKWGHLIQINQLVKTSTVSPTSQTEAELTTPKTAKIILYQIFLKDS